MSLLKWSIYVLKHPRTGEVRYVGFTSCAAKLRLRWHVKSAFGGRQKTPNICWIRSLRSKGLKPVMEIIESGSGEGWQEAERRWIAHYKATGVRLLNMTEGGDGAPGWGTPELRSAAMKKANAARTPAQMSASSKKGNASWTPKQREKWKKKIQSNPEQKSASLKNYWASPAADERRRKLIERLAARTPEQKSLASIKQWAGLAPEERSAKALAAARKRSPISAQQKAAKAECIKQWHASRTPEERSAATKKGHITRAINQAARSVAAPAAVD
jgi:hypothetical protein